MNQWTCSQNVSTSETDSHDHLSITVGGHQLRGCKTQHTSRQPDRDAKYHVSYISSPEYISPGEDYPARPKKK